MIPSVFTFRTCIAILYLLVSATAGAQNAEYRIFKGGDEVGKIQVSKAVKGDRTLYDMDSYSEFSIIWKQVVRTSVRAEYLDNVLISCNSAFILNGSVRDSSNMYSEKGMEHCYVHPKKLDGCGRVGEWSTARMYFEEPVNALQIFVESVLENCTLEATGKGTYTLTFPNNTKNHYTYLNGILEEIQVVRPFFDLIFRRAV